MSRLRTHNNRRRAWIAKQPICCPKHGKPWQGNGWVYAAGLSFAAFQCPVVTCRRIYLHRCERPS